MEHLDQQVVSKPRSRKMKKDLVGAALLGAIFASAPANAETGDAWVSIGTLSCHEKSGWGFIFGASSALNCNFSHSGKVEYLAGHYGGVTAGATVGVGLDANALIGGSSTGIDLQPLSIQGNTGLNVAAGIAELTLHARSGG